jgi:hypothetical protein
MSVLSRELCEIIEGIEIRGGNDFRRRTRESLRLLREAPDFPLVQGHVKIICQGRRSGMKAWAKKPTFVVGKATWQHSSLWYAGAIAHDAFHAKLYATAKRTTNAIEPASEAWTGVDAERKCLAFQYEVLQTLKGDESTLKYIAECAKNPTYQGRNHGWGSWLDYLRRWW